MSTKPEVDEFHGVGGSYIVENGVRRRLEEPTKDHPEGNAPRDKDGNLIVHPEKERTKAQKKPTPASQPEAAATSSGAAKKGGSK